MSKPGNSSFKKAFKTIIWPRRNLLFLGLILIIINRMSGLVLPGSTKVLIDDIIISKNTDQLWLLLSVVALAIIIQSVTSFSLTRLLSVEAQNLISKLRSAVQKHIVRLPISYFDNNKSGALVSRIMTDVEGTRNLVGTGFVNLIGGGLTAIVAFFILLQISVPMTIYVLLPLIIFGVISLFAFRKIRPIFRKRGEINAEVTGRLTESLNGIRVIKGFNAEESEISTFEKGVEKLFTNVKQSLTATSLVTSSATLLLGLASVGIMGLGGFMIIEGKLTIGDFFAFVLYLGFMIAPIVQMTDIGSQMTEALAGLDRMEEVMSVQREDENQDRNLSLSTIHGTIEFKHVGFEYEVNNPVLHDISFTAEPGTVTALVGSSGSGKTTIAGLFATFITPQSGEILIDGINLSNVKTDDYRKYLGVVLQDEFLFEGSIRENILFPRPHASEAELMAAVKASNVTEFSSRFEKGLDTIIGERGVKLSGGQRQRVSIARALIANPKILILDEATSSLDTESEGLIQESLQQLMKGRTTLVIAHRLSTIKKANQILVIENGRIVERGTHEDLISKQGRYYNLYTYQAKI